MSETTTTTSTAAAKGANKAAKTIIEAVEHASDHIAPSVVETAEVALALDVPTKVVVNQKLVVTVTAIAAAGLGVAGVLGYQKLQARRKAKKLQAEVEEIVTENKASENS